MAYPTVKRGYVLVRKGHANVSAIVSLKHAKELQRRFGGRIVNVAGHEYRMAQKTLRVLVDHSSAYELPSIS